MRYLWKLYYLFNKPRTKFELCVHYARLRGLKYTNLKMSSVEPADFIGIPHIGKRE